MRGEIMDTWWLHDLYMEDKMFNDNEDNDNNDYNEHI